MKGNQADMRLPHGNAEGQEMMELFLWSYEEKRLFPSNISSLYTQISCIKNTGRTF